MSIHANAALGEKMQDAVIMKLIAHVQDLEEMLHSQDLRHASGNHEEGTDRPLRILHVYIMVFTKQL